MVRHIVKDTRLLSRVSEPASEDDRQIIEDLKDTLAANREGCVGMAANMIGSLKRIIIVAEKDGDLIMINPMITKHIRPYQTEEGCLSLSGVRPTRRFQKIRVRFLDEAFREQEAEFEDFTAQIIQHECDHLEGIVI